jgi:hypothetical protein
MFENIQFTTLETHGIVLQSLLLFSYRLAIGCSASVACERIVSWFRASANWYDWILAVPAARLPPAY